MEEVMSLLSKGDVLKLKEAFERDPYYLERIDEDCRDVFNKVYVPEETLATWTHYYVCPKHSVRLNVDYYDSEHYVCPVDGEVFTGEPYRGAWWDIIVSRTADRSYLLAIAYVATGKEKYLKPLREILLGYAKAYPGYVVHGGIPYNKPGKMTSQALSDAGPLCNLAYAYDVAKDAFTKEEQKFIEDGLFRPGANHLKEYSTPQLHNHEVVILGTLGVIGLAIGDDSLVEHALNCKYGLKYQIENSYTEDGFWFEMCMGYHLFSMMYFIRFEKMARGTRFSLFDDKVTGPLLRKALVFPINLCYKDGSIPKMGDGTSGFYGSEGTYEYPYAYFGGEDLRYCLSVCYGERERKNLDALIFGSPDFKPSVDYPIKNYLAKGGTNFAVLHGSEERYFLFKASPYGGEHDHYDRLALSFSAFGKPVSVDMGTAAGYGAPLHYAYYKNTATHNTVVVDGENMPPCETVIESYEAFAEDDIRLAAHTLPYEKFGGLDSFTIKQWSDEAYANTSMRRIVRFRDKYFIDIFKVSSDNELNKDWTWHTVGETVIPEGVEPLDKVNEKGPQSFFSEARVKLGKGVERISVVADDYVLDTYAYAEGKQLVFAKGPDCPSTSLISYLIERSNERCPLYVNVIEAHRHGEAVIDKVDVSVTGDEVTVTVYEKSGKIFTISENMTI